MSYRPGDADCRANRRLGRTVLCGSLYFYFGGQGALDSRQRLLGTGGLRTAGLSHVGAATAALAAQRFGAATDELDRVKTARQVRRNTDNDGRLAIGARNDRHHARADLTLQ